VFESLRAVENLEIDTRRQDALASMKQASKYHAKFLRA
jgi:hypothetical protein